MTKKRNPNDATMRNINSLKKRVASLETSRKVHAVIIRQLMNIVRKLVEV